MLRLAAKPKKDETGQGLNRMQENLDEVVVSLKKRRTEHGPAQDTRKAIDIVLMRIDVHGTKLCGHAIQLPESLGGGVRLVSGTNFSAEHYCAGFKNA